MIIRRATQVVAGTTRALRAVCLVRLLAKGNAPERGPRDPAKRRGRAAAGMSSPRKESVGAFASRYEVASSFGRHCSALRGRTIRVVAFRAFHPAKPPSRQRRLFSGSLSDQTGSRFACPDYNRWHVNLISVFRMEMGLDDVDAV